MKAQYGPGDPVYAQAARVVASHIAGPNPADATGMGAVYFDTNGTWQSEWAGKTTKKIGNHFFYETTNLKPKNTVASTPASAMIDAASNAALAGIDAAVPAGTVNGATTGTLAALSYNVGGNRNLKVKTELEVSMQQAVTAVYGPGYEIVIKSAIQNPELPKASTSARHYHERPAADIVVLAPDGTQLSNKALLPLEQHWLATKVGSVGAPAPGNGNWLHLDLAGGTGPGSYPLIPGEGRYWTYGTMPDDLNATLIAARDKGIGPSEYAIDPALIAAGNFGDGVLAPVSTDDVPRPLPRDARPRATLAQQVSDTRAEAIAEAREGARQMVQAQVAAKMGAGNNAFTPRIEYLDGSYWIDGVPMPIAYDGTFAPFDPNIGAAVDSMSRDADTVSPYGAITFREPVGDWMSMNQLFDDTGQPSSAPVPKLTRAEIIEGLGVSEAGLNAKPPPPDALSDRPVYDRSTGLFVAPGMDANVAFDPRTGLVMPVGGRERVRADAFTAIDMATAMQVVLAPVAGVRVPQGPTMDPIGAGASFRGVEAMKRSVAGMTAAQLQAIVASIPAPRTAPAAPQFQQGMMNRGQPYIPEPLPRDARPKPGKIDVAVDGSAYDRFYGTGKQEDGGGVVPPASKLTNDASQPAAPAPKKVISTTPGAYGPQFAVIGVKDKPIKEGTKVQIGSTVKTTSGDRVAVLNVRTGLAMLVKPAQVAKELNQQKRDAIFDYAKNNLGLDDRAAGAFAEIDEVYGKNGSTTLVGASVRAEAAKMLGKEITGTSSNIKMGITSLIGSGFAFARSVVPAAAKAAVGAAVAGASMKLTPPSMATVKPGAVSKPAQQRATVIRQRTEDVSLPPAAAPKPPAAVTPLPFNPMASVQGSQKQSGAWGTAKPVYKIIPATYKTVKTVVPPTGMVASGAYNVKPEERAAFSGSAPGAPPAAAPTEVTTRVVDQPERRVQVSPGGGITAPERRAAPSRPTPPPTVQIKTGKKVAVGTTYQQGKSGSGKPYTYQVQKDGSIKNLTTGRTTSSATTKTTTSTAGLKPGDRVYNADTNSWDLKR
jgi:hypothetical protein